MTKQAPPKRGTTRRRKRSDVATPRAATSAPVKVELVLHPPTIAKPKRIHTRHVLPLIGEGQERAIHSISREIAYHAENIRAVAAGEEIRLLVNTELAQPAKSRTASNVDEPSCSISKT